MTSKFLACFLSFLTTLTLQPVLAGQTTVSDQSVHHHYKFVDLGTFGGPISRNDGIYPALNNEGTVIGMADTSAPDPFYPNFNPLILPGGASDPYIFRAFESRYGQLVALDPIKRDVKRNIFPSPR